MAVQDKDKLVSLEDLKTAYDDLDGDISDVKNTITLVANVLLEEYTSSIFGSDGYYAKLDTAVQTNEPYIIKITPTTSLLNVKIQLGTNGSASSMVDTIAQGVSFDVNSPFVSTFYKPTGDYNWLRISVSDAGATVKIYKLIDVLSAKEDIDFLMLKHEIKPYGLTLGTTDFGLYTPDLGQGWSGTQETGFAHQTGNTDAIIIGTPILQGTYYVTFRIVSLDTSKDGCSGITISIGGSNGFDIYEGNFEEHTYVLGIKSNGSSSIKITPNTRFAGTIYDLSIKKILNTTKGSHELSDANDNVCVEIKTQYDDESIAIGRNNFMYDVGGDGNVAVGVKASENNTSGFWNTALGHKALQENTVGSRNIAIGYIALQHNISGNRNIAIGTFALNSCTHGIHNIALGADTMQRLTTGLNNIGIGINALAHVTTQEGNVGIGYDSLGSVENGKNTAVGWKAGNGIVTGSENVVIGSNADADPSVSNAIVIGANVQGKNTSEIRIGTTSHEYVLLAGKKIIFNDDGTVTWEAETLAEMV